MLMEPGQPATGGAMMAVGRPFAAMAAAVSLLGYPVGVLAADTYTMPSSRTYVDRDANTENIPKRLSGTLDPDDLTLGAQQLSKKLKEPGVQQV